MHICLRTDVPLGDTLRVFIQYGGRGNTSEQKFRDMKDRSDRQQAWNFTSSSRRTVAMDFVLSGAAACGACLFTNPLEVVKTRMQLQGELKSRGTYQIYYRNVFHAFYTIGKVEGVVALQKGLSAGLLYQFFMNGVRLGSYAIIESSGYIHTNGRVNAVKTTLAGAVAGVVGAVMGSPIYLVSSLRSLCSNSLYYPFKFDQLWHCKKCCHMEIWRKNKTKCFRWQVKTHLQSQATSSIAVGHQYKHQVPL